ncbi:AAA family ATPase [Shimia sagamensis]|uniref:Predicted kinase n=1 Tax=Shimia sagamensis TaxID=1566352 RepID=A0ABY1NWR5_9RHOB|nr:ATP-binding protein [Shimia sagamensis]SMP19210.1 Predicted kinase [Shimia sagamensis]
MSVPSPTLHLMCGLAASGKSTLARCLASETGGVVISEDQWLSALFTDELHSLADYVRYSARLRHAMGPHVVALLQARQTVVMDFPANTLSTRHWLGELARQAGVRARLHYLDVPQDICRNRAMARNQNGTHPFQLTMDQFDHLASYFEIPSANEGFELVLHKHS